MEYKPTTTKYKNLYRKLIRLYPSDYRERFEETMLQTFDDLYNERRSQHKGTLGFVLWVVADTLTHVIKENLKLFTIHVKNAPSAILGLVLLLPFSLLFTVGLSWQILHTLGFASSPNVGSLVPSRNLGIGIALVLPALALLLNIGAIVIGAIRTRSSLILSMQFVKTNFAMLAIVVLSAGAIIFMVGHDSIPCFVHGIMANGFSNTQSLISVCRNA